MDNLSSSELDSPSKTPLFIAIAAIIVAIAALWLAWSGFSRSAALEKQLADIGNASERLAELESAVADQGSRLDQIGSGINQLSQQVSGELTKVGDDISKIKKNVRSVAIEAGTAKRMVEELEKIGVKPAAAAPAPRQASTGKSPDTPAGDSSEGMYTIKSGDTLGRVAAAYKITLNQLLAANPGVDPRRLRIGQQVVIPAGQ